MSMFGPVFSPVDVANTAVENPGAAIGKMVINAGVEAIQQAVNPTPEQKAEEERAREEQGKKEAQKREEDRKEQEQLRLLMEARQQADLVQASKDDPRGTAPSINRADMLGRAGPGVLDDGIAFDQAAVELEAKRQEVIAEITRSEQGPSHALSVEISGLAGFQPELPFSIFERAGVIRLSLQNDEEIDPALSADPDADVQRFDHGEKVQVRDDGRRVRVRLDFADGTHVNTELDFKRAEAEEDAGTDIAGRIAPKADQGTRAAA